MECVKILKSYKNAMVQRLCLFYSTGKMETKRLKKSGEVETQVHIKHWRSMISLQDPTLTPWNSRNICSEALQAKQEALVQSSSQDNEKGKIMQRYCCLKKFRKRLRRALRLQSLQKPSCPFGTLVSLLAPTTLGGPVICMSPTPILSLFLWLFTASNVEQVII